MNANKRQIHYINPAIQQRLIISFIVVELMLIGLTIGWLYQDMNQLIENNMFKIHIQNTLTVEFFTIRIAQAAFVLLIANIIMASLVIWYWRNYINKIITPLNDIADSIQNLDFTFKPNLSVQHEATNIAVNWLNNEKDCFIKVRHYLSMINMENTESTNISLDRCRELLEK